jgi:hypothetical protein
MKSESVRAGLPSGRLVRVLAMALLAPALARLRRRGAAAGDPLKAGVRKAWSDLTAAVREASKRYRATS